MTIDPGNLTFAVTGSYGSWECAKELPEVLATKLPGSGYGLITGKQIGVAGTVTSDPGNLALP